MFFDNLDDMSSIIHELKESFESGDCRTLFAEHKIDTYTELEYEFVCKYVPKFRAWVRRVTSDCADVVVIKEYASKMTRHRDIFSNKEDECYTNTHVNSLYLVWTGTLPNP